MCVESHENTQISAVLCRGVVLDIINGVFWFNRQCCYFLTLQYVQK